MEPQPDQVIDSSPAIGRIFNGAMGIVVGTGNYWGGATQTDHLIAMDPSCSERWDASLNDQTLGSPALADILGTRDKVQVVEVTSTTSASGPDGTVYVLNSSTGGNAPNWPQQATAPIVGFGGASTADLSGRGYQDVVVPTIAGVDVFDGRSGKLLTSPALGYGQIATQSTPLLTQQGPNRVGITIAGYGVTSSDCPAGEAVCLQGIIMHYVVTAKGATVGPADQSWPMFHHDPHLTGNLASPSTP